VILTIFKKNSEVTNDVIKEMDDVSFHLPYLLSYFLTVIVEATNLATIKEEAY
jgi:hypothetical protein